jgi:hypothetical protein
MTKWARRRTKPGPRWGEKETNGNKGKTPIASGVEGLCVS